MPASPRRAVTSLTKTAPAATAARATAAFEVSIETGTPPVAVSASTTGITRRSSSSALTGAAPGRVDSPPTSIRSAPSLAISPACATAAAGSRNAPPSENESGVMFSTPITAGRAKLVTALAVARARAARSGGSCR